MFLEKKDIEVSVKNLKELLANTYVLLVKIQNFHWNVEDPRFQMLHNFFSHQYDLLSEAVDETAERIRMLGEYAPGSMAVYLKLTSLQESESIKDGNIMLKNLASDHNAIIGSLRKAIEQVSLTKDEGTLDFLIGRLQEHEKLEWMTSSHFAK